MKRILLLSSILVSSLGAQAQHIKGKTVDTANQSIIGANITLMKSTDSSVVKYSISDADGQFIFEKVDAGSYLLKVETFGGSQLTNSFKTDGIQDTNLPDIKVVPSVQSLKTVVVTNRKPIVELKADRTILNVEGTINATGQTGLELMRKSPGVVVDKDDNLMLNGKNGITLYIDGRPSPLSGNDLSNWLKSLPSDNVEAIEIITNPSAKYDASGNAGIINIRLKKNKNFGTNGTVNAGLAYGAFLKGNAGISLNNRNKFMNIYTSYNFSKGKSLNKMRFQRWTNDTAFDQNTQIIGDKMNHSYKAGVDFNLSPKSSIGIMANGSYVKADRNFESRTLILDSATSVVQRQMTANNKMETTNKNINGNINYTYQDPKKSKKITVDFDYGYYNNQSEQLQPNVYLNANNEVLFENNYKINAPAQISILSGRADYEFPVLGGKGEVGVKTSTVTTNNDFVIFNDNASNWVKDRDKSNEFEYLETVNAAYINYNKQFDGFMLQAGLRGEATQSRGHSVGEKRINGSGVYEKYDTTFPRSYVDLFPSFAVSLNKNPMSQFSLSYSRRIDRPSYSKINPFEFRIDEYTYEKGNTQLKPQYTNSFSLAHTYMYILNTKLSYDRVNGMFARVINKTNDSRLYQTEDNLASQDVISLSVSSPFQHKKFSGFLSLNGNYSLYRADFGQGVAINYNVYSFNGFAQVAYSINDWLKAEMSGWYTAPGVYQGTFRSNGMGGVDAGLQAKVLKGNGNLKLSLGDVFNTMKWGGHTNYAGQRILANGSWESQQVRLNFSYKFGNKNIKSKERKRSLEEQKRVNASSGNMGG